MIKNTTINRALGKEKKEGTRGKCDGCKRRQESEQGAINTDHISLQNKAKKKQITFL